MSSQIENQVVEFEPLKGFENDYEILNDYPFTIRRKNNHRVVKDSLNQQTGYIINALNGKLYLKHRLIALQFLANDDPINKDVIDHVNHDRTDFHLSNLRWCSSSDNNYNKSSHRGIQYEFIDNIPDDAIAIEYYDTRTERREFGENKYYYYRNETTNEDIFYSRIDEELYRILHINTTIRGSQIVNLRDIDNKLVGMMVNRFKHQHGI